MVPDRVSNPQLPLAVGGGTIRAYETRDRQAVREICCRTAYRNRGTDTVFEDTALIADYWTAYYTDYEPESALVVEENGQVVGYLFGCCDTNRHIRLMATRILPPLLFKLLLRFVTGRYRKRQTYRMIKWWATASWREAPPIPLDRYPAHYHCNILREGLGKRYYSTMAMIFVDRIEALGIPGLHGAVEEAASGGPWTRMVAGVNRPDLIEYRADRPSTLLRDVLGEPKSVVNRVWGARIDTYRLFLSIVASKYGI